MENITVIGSGTMGNGIAHVFAQSGFKVYLVDVSEDALNIATQTISKNLERMIKKEVITVEQKTEILGRITTTTSFKQAVKEADLVIEAVSENLDLKLKIFRELDDLCKNEAIMATNTSSISITKIASVTRQPDKVIGMHFMNPVPVMKLVEVIRGYKTSDSTTKTIFELTEKLGKIPVEVNDYPGFVSNRVLLPMINEAIIALQEGVAGVAEIDTVMKLGMAHPMGPLQLADFIGLDVCLSILNVLFEGLGKDKYAPCSLLVKMVDAGMLGVKTGEGFYKWEKNSKELIVSEYFK